MDMEYGFDNLDETERGNTYLASDGSHILFIHLNVDFSDCELSQFLQVSVEPENYPSMKVETIYIYLKDLGEHIREHCNGWLVYKWNLPFPAPMTEEGRIDGEIEIDYEVEGESA
jgi:hypothetical protein